MDAVGQLPQVGQHLARLVLELHQLERTQLAALEPLAGQPEAGDERHDALLDAVVQVALDASSLLVLRGDEPDPGGAELIELLVERAVRRTLATVVVACRATVWRSASSAASYSPVPARAELQRPRRSSPRTRSWVATGIPDDVAGDGGDSGGLARRRRAP